MECANGTITSPSHCSGQAEAKDADLKALASKMLPVVQGHLKHARELSTSVASK
ncbi:DUF4142 domain-containing protein [Variovorax sp. IB41]|uniref:DUF4142 domain-containing protein n=1 Tax=Variovorax sp. IB41 TaxID=2779370 RepID=UPI001E42AFE5|nr:DUF4142 domain-containing protein [Variovorax sp. IB41]